MATNSSTMCVCGDNQQVAEIGSDNAFVPHTDREGKPCPGMPLNPDHPLCGEPIETVNDHLVGTASGRIVMVLPPVTPMETEEALRFAAWIVMCATVHRVDAEARFAAILRAIKRT